MNAYTQQRDFYDWCLSQAKMLRGKNTCIDWEGIAEEIESLGESLKRELKSRLIVLITHLLKWHYQPDKRSRSWFLTILEQRREIDLLLEDNPSLASKVQEFVEIVYPKAVKAFSDETRIHKNLIPISCPFSIEDILISDILLEEN